MSTAQRGSGPLHATHPARDVQQHSVVRQSLDRVNGRLVERFGQIRLHRSRVDGGTVTSLSAKVEEIGEQSLTRLVLQGERLLQAGPRDTDRQVMPQFARLRIQTAPNPGWRSDRPARTTGRAIRSRRARPNWWRRARRSSHTVRPGPARGDPDRPCSGRSRPSSGPRRGTWDRRSGDRPDCSKPRSVRWPGYRACAGASPTSGAARHGVPIDVQLLVQHLQSKL